MADNGVSKIYSLLRESAPLYKSRGHKAKFVNVDAGVKRNVMFCVHVSGCPGGSYEEV